MEEPRSSDENEPQTESASPEQKTETPSGSSRFVWRTRETRGGRKSGDWYFLLWTGAIAGAAIAVLLENILFALLLILSAFTISVTVSKPPREIELNVSNRGVKAGTLLFPYSSLSAFYILTLETEESLLILEPSRPLGSRNVFPIAEDIDIGELREFLLKHLKEEELDIPFSDKIADSFGI